MAINPTIVVVEDDKDIQEYLKDVLSENHYLVYTTGKGIEAMKIIDQVNPQLILLDLGLPDIEGESLCTQIKDSHPAIPIIMLTAKDDARDIAAGLNLGADDYVTKPFSINVLLARIQARLRDIKPTKVLEAGDLKLNTETFEVTRSDQSISLTQTEFQLLHYLLSNKNRVLTREMILNHVWSYTPDVESRVVDVYIGYLRKKIDHNFNPKLINSVRGFGYSLKES
jgi:DNA-binding response OmpR family regulator